MPPDRPSLLVVILEGIGDIVLSMPLLSIISHSFKEYERYLWLSPGRADLFFGWDSFHLVEVGDEEKTTQVLSKYHDFVFDPGTSNDHVIDWIPHSELKYGTYVGFVKPKTVPREKAVPRPLHAPLWRQFTSLVSKLGISWDVIPEFGIHADPLSRAYAEMLVHFRSGVPLICLAPGASCDDRKRWPPEHFATFMRKFRAARPCRFVLVGDRSEMGIGDAVTGLLEFDVDNLIGLTNLGSLVHILKESRLLLANDNGVMHLGGVASIPTIGLFGPSNPEVFSPLGMTSTVIAAPSGNVADIDPEYVTKVSLDLVK
jgi:ADP-heptose:LPS heptosyltransferase